MLLCETPHEPVLVSGGFTSMTVGTSNVTLLNFFEDDVPRVAFSEEFADVVGFFRRVAVIEVGYTRVLLVAVHARVLK